MNSKITLGSVRKASGWSMLWGILMFICGILAISLPLASSIGIVIVLAWLILFAAICHLIFAFQSHGVGGFLWPGAPRLSVRDRRNLYADEPAFGRALSYAGLGRLSFVRRSRGDHFLFQDPRGRERWLGFVRRHYHLDSRIFNLASLAVELGLGYRNIGRDQLDL